MKRAVQQTLGQTLGRASAPSAKRQATRKEWTVVNWNVNGMRACVKKDNGFLAFLERVDPDIVCLGETKCSFEASPVKDIPGYHTYWMSGTIKKGGYAGVAVFSKVKAMSVTYGLSDVEESTTEGRLITLEFPAFYLVHCYVPNSGGKLERLQWRTETWDKHLREHLIALNKTKHVVWAGDLNVAHLEIDIHNPDGNRNKSAGFCDAERDNFTRVLDAGFTDAYRHLHPEEEGYTYWSYRFNARARNMGWRLDYFVVNNDFAPHVKQVWVDKTQTGSDHVPLIMTLDETVSVNAESK